MAESLSWGREYPFHHRNRRQRNSRGDRTESSLAVLPKHFRLPMSHGFRQIVEGEARVLGKTRATLYPQPQF